MNAHMSARRSTCLLLALAFSVTVAAAGEPKEGSSNAELRIREKHFPVFFQDSSLTDAERRAVVDDYQMLLDHLAQRERRTFSNPKLVEEDERAVRIIGAFELSAKYLKRPDEYEHEFGLIGKSADGQEHIVIRQKLSDGYRAAMQLKKTHDAACRSLPSFVTLLNNLTDESMPAVKYFFYLHGAFKQNSEELANAPKHKIIEEYGRSRHSCVSMLELRMFEGRLATMVYAMKKDDGRVYNKPVIYDDDRWKVIIALPGT